MKNKYKLLLIIFTVLFLSANLIIYWHSIIPFSANIDLTKNNVTHAYSLNFVPPGKNTYALGLSIPNMKHEDSFPAPAGSPKTRADIRDLDIILRVVVMTPDKHPIFDQEEPIKYWTPTNMPLPSGSNETLYKQCGTPTAYAKDFAKKELNIDLSDIPCFKSELFKRYLMQITVVKGQPQAATFKPQLFIFPKLMGEELIGMVIFVNGVLLVALLSSLLITLIYVSLGKYFKKK